MKTWLFWDWWHIEHQDNAQILQGRPEWHAEAVYEDPTFDYLGFWPRVYRDDEAGLWRMLYVGSGFPLTLLGAESDDGIYWRPMDRPDIQPQGEKFAPNHLHTVEAANGGPVYIDPCPEDGRPFKLYCIQRGGPVAQRAMLDESSYFHELVKGEGSKPYLAEQLLVTSEDGLHWTIDPEARWGSMSWRPDPPVCCFYREKTGDHIMMIRPGWGDRRIAMQKSVDARNWSGPELILQPDLLDPPQTQIYGMPVFPYEGGYVGFLWMAHFSSSEPLQRFNQLWGRIDSQLVHSHDGLHFQRGYREPFIPLNEPGLPGSGVIYPVSLIKTDEEIRIYSSSTMDLHHQNTTRQFCRKGEMPPSSILLHTLRRDGFMYLASRGHRAGFITKPLVFMAPALHANVLCPHGEVLFQLTDMESRPLEGFGFEDCVPCRGADETAFPVRWRQKTLADVLNRVVRLEVRFRHARLFAFRGDFHFVDALDVALLDDGKPIDSTFMDY